MNEPTLPVRVERGEGGEIGLLSPAVGWWSHHPPEGARLGPGSCVGTLTILGRRFALVVPDEAAGQVLGPLPRDRAVPVEFGQPLCRLALASSAGGAQPDLRAGSPDPAPAAARQPRTWAVLSPTDGVFYRRPAPEARPFVEPGSRVRAGQPLGLVEVMKTFNLIPYGGSGLPEEAEVVEVCCGDAEEVRAGQVLVVVR